MFVCRHTLGILHVTWVVGVSGDGVFVVGAGAIGAAVGTNVGAVVGALVGVLVGTFVGVTIGALVGIMVGTRVGDVVDGTFTIRNDNCRIDPMVPLTRFPSYVVTVRLC
jgi:outer membrane lipoprotein SlyB